MITTKNALPTFEGTHLLKLDNEVPSITGKFFISDYEFIIKKKDTNHGYSGSNLFLCYKHKDEIHDHYLTALMKEKIIKSIPCFIIDDTKYTSTGYYYSLEILNYKVPDADEYVRITKLSYKVKRRS